MIHSGELNIHMQFLSEFVTSSHKNGCTYSRPNLETMCEAVLGAINTVTAARWKCCGPGRPWSPNSTSGVQRLAAFHAAANDSFSQPAAAVRAQRALGEEQQGVVYLTMMNGVLDLYVD